MTAKPTDLTEQPNAQGTDSAKLLREGLRSLHLSGAIFLRAHFTAPWAYDSPSSEDFVEWLQPAGRRIILFHVFTEGRCRIELHRGGAAEMEAGDIAIIPFGDSHRVGDPTLDRTVPVQTLLPPTPWTTLPVIHYGGGGTPTSMVCGYLYCDDLPFNPVLSSLPPLMRVSAGDGTLAKWVEASVQYALYAARGGGANDDPLFQRLPELMFTEGLCEFMRQNPDSNGGWIRGLTDPIVGRALSFMHREPAHAWTLEELARSVATSRSVLDERFRTVLGSAPMTYLTNWRLQLASRQLRTTTASLAEIASATGYGSEASLSRAFKRQVGVSPGHWRRSVRNDVE
jgi:AraC-like DNA-binding protein